MLPFLRDRDVIYMIPRERNIWILQDRRVYGHQGTSEGIVCNLYVEPISGLTVAILCNGCQAVRDNGVMSMSRRLIGIVEEAFL